MKILLIGEFSGVHNNLKKGLLSLGHEVKLAADGDGYRKFGSDIQLSRYKGKFFGKLFNILYLYMNFKKFIGYDIIQFINPFSLPYYFYYFGIPQLLFLLNKKCVYYTCGTDPAFIESENKFEYFPFDDKLSLEYPRYSRFELYYYNWFIRKIDLIIPSMYTYAVGYWDNPKLSLPIPLPGSGVYVNKTNSLNKKVKVLFGITRRGFKGASYILEALAKIESKYSDFLVVNIVEKLTFHEYEKIISEADILIDQCKSYDYGMNAVFALEKGLIVLSGNEPVSSDFLKISDNNIINIKPNSVFIKKILEDLIERKNRDELQNMKIKSVLQAQKYHEPKKVAKLFILSYNH